MTRLDRCLGCPIVILDQCPGHVGTPRRDRRTRARGPLHNDQLLQHFSRHLLGEPKKAAEIGRNYRNVFLFSVLDEGLSNQNTRVVDKGVDAPKTSEA